MKLPRQSKPQKRQNAINKFHAPTVKRDFKILGKIGNTLLKIAAVALIAGLLYVIGKRVYTMVLESYKPNAVAFSKCSNYFTQIKTKPTYGIVFDTKGDEVQKIYFTSPSGSGLKSIIVEQTDWFVVYFSNNFTFTPVREFLRLSKLERGSLDYCYLLEQLSLTSGVPLEYVIVNDSKNGLSSTLSVSQSKQILDSVAKSDVLHFQQKLLPLYLLVDGTNVPVITYSSFKEQFPTFFRIDEVSQEQVFVEVYNATSIDGYASIIAKKWSMLGIEVSRVNNATYPESTDAAAIIYVKSLDQYPRTMALIKSSLPQGKIEVKVGRPTHMVTTGDIVVFLLKR